jgi:hypothetical protein
MSSESLGIKRSGARERSGNRQIPINTARKIFAKKKPRKGAGLKVAEP